MRLASFATEDGPSFGLVVGDAIVDLPRRSNGRYRSLREALAAGALGEIAGLASATPDHRLSEVTLLPTVPDPGKILCVGLNYLSHVGEGGGRSAPEFPRFFSRFSDSVVGHGTPIVAPRASTHFDYEGELALIVGKPGRHIEAGRALDHIAGYTCFNDGSLRDYQNHTTTAGKNFHASGALGPWMVTADEVPDPTRLTLTTRLNGEEMQRAGTGELIHSIGKLIEYVSRITPLVPGDVIATGTPEGVAAHRKPPRWLKPGDVVEVEISGIGVLRNPVVAEEA